ncbi:MAG: mechanosensitive ion channel family protein [Ruminococcaceae bacterium]|nr:mechanosensitive ion channel family protein [Oscillospiraceae bacterium]
MKEKKQINVAFLIVALLFCMITVAAFALSGYIYGVNSVFYKNISSNVALNTMYQKIPALIKTIQIITIAYLLNFLVSMLLKKILSRSKRGMTITTLVISFLKYLIAIIAVFLILGAWGVDTRALLASAGILGLIVGLGAQSMIADILAGISIVFEGEYQVGDIVVIDGWRGTVEEIGVRTTKIKDAGGNVKIVNNSAISTVINQTKDLSIAKAYISIEYGMPIPQAELIIKKNLDRIREAIPQIQEGPYYKGVDKLAESSVDLLFTAACKEEDLYIVQRALNRELKIMFDENGINIPFPQVTISQLEATDTKTQPSEKKEASSFVAEQAKLSKNLEESRN